MNKIGATLDLIELSPRLLLNVSDKVTTLNLKKTASDLGSSGLPVGQLLASTGSLSLFDFDDEEIEEIEEQEIIVEEAPKPVKEGISKDEAEKVKAQLEGAGAQVSVK